MGLEVGDLELIGNFLLTPGGSDEFTAIYAGRVRAPAADWAALAGGGGLAAEHEDIRLLTLPAAQAIEAAIAGNYANSVTAIALLWLAARREWLQNKWLRS
jgi:ADP-ribose pyrophosphatase